MAAASRRGLPLLCHSARSICVCRTLDDVKEGIVAARIAAHSADIAKGLPGAMDWDNAMSTARKQLDWDKMFELAIDPEKARAYRESSRTGKRRHLQHVRELLRG